MSGAPGFPQPTSKLPAGLDPARRYTEAEYRALSDRTAERLEMYGGFVVVRDWDPLRMMAGGSLRHTTLGDNALVILRSLARTTGCRAYRSDVRIADAPNATFVYPDAVYVCDPVWTWEETADLANPTVLIEVLSPATAESDRTRKYDLYASLPSVRAILYVSSESIRVEVYERVREHVWFRTDVRGREGTVRVSGPDLQISMSELYENVEIAGED